MALKLDDISINTLIGHGTAISGDIKINGFVRIDGDIDGNIETDGNIILSEHARIRGNINAKSIIVGGIILGNIHSYESVKLLPEAVVLGDIITQKLQIEDKANFHGHCISIKNKEEFEKETDKYLQTKALQEKVII
ncbi:MAG: polymer-forming cytoskeletal protein [Treponema sp.]|nr:polymer-forming cytoskeletal protein [Treponema sp.]